MKGVEQAREYARKNGAHLTAHRDGTITVKFTKHYRGGDYTRFWKDILRILRGVDKRLENHEYVPSPNTYSGKFPEKKVKATFKEVV